MLTLLNEIRTLLVNNSITEIKCQNKQYVCKILAAKAANIFITCELC